MTDEKELHSLIERMRAHGCDLIVKFEEGSAGKATHPAGYIDTVQFVGVKGCGPHPCSSITAAERMREVLARLDRENPAKAIPRAPAPLTGQAPRRAQTVDTRYEVENAREKINGYYEPTPYERTTGKQAEAFDRAKAECVMHLQRQLALVEGMTFDQFKSRR
ncbi:hypothetical protein [Paraburkholderia sp. GAS32]|uniref:hypothetical protein n=1 Tax=Paraburkholderia sp. GAS32 TaxID=3035129 RepID=UPI003D1DC876